MDKGHHQGQGEPVYDGSDDLVARELEVSLHRRVSVLLVLGFAVGCWLAWRYSITVTPRDLGCAAAANAVAAVVGALSALAYTRLVLRAFRAHPGLFARTRVRSGWRPTLAAPPLAVNPVAWLYSLPGAVSAVIGVAIATRCAVTDGSTFVATVILPITLSATAAHLADSVLWPRFRPGHPDASVCSLLEGRGYHWNRWAGWRRARTGAQPATVAAPPGDGGS